MKKLEETPDGYLNEAIRLDDISRVSSRSGDFRTAAAMRRESEWFFAQAAAMETAR